MILSHMVTDLSSLSASNGHRACNYKELMNNLKAYTLMYKATKGSYIYCMTGYAERSR